MKFKTTLQPKDSLVDLTPLVDVVLLMLIFFMIASDVLPLKSLNVETPKLDIFSTPQTTQVLVVMDMHGVIYVGSKKEIVDLNAFKQTLIREIKKHPTPSVVLSIDKSVEYGDFLKLLAYTQETKVPVRLVYQDTSD